MSNGKRIDPKAKCLRLSHDAKKRSSLCKQIRRGSAKGYLPTVLGSRCSGKAQGPKAVVDVGVLEVHIEVFV